MVVMALPGGLEVFENSDFDVKAYLNEHRKLIPLFQLRNAAEVEVSNVKGRIINLINDNYNAFINVAAELHGVGLKFSSAGELLDQLNGDVLSSAAKVEAVSERVDGVLSLKRRTDSAIRDKRVLLESYQCLCVIAERLNRVEGAEWLRMEGPYDDASRSTLVDAAAVHKQQLAQHQALGGDTTHSAASRASLDGEGAQAPEGAGVVVSAQPLQCAVQWSMIGLVALSSFARHCGLLDVSTEDLQRVNSVLTMLEDKCGQVVTDETHGDCSNNKLSQVGSSSCADMIKDVQAVCEHSSELQEVRAYWTAIRARCLDVLQRSLQIVVRLVAQSLTLSRSGLQPPEHTSGAVQGTAADTGGTTAQLSSSREGISRSTIDVLFNSLGPLHKACRALNCTDFLIQICKATFVQSALVWAVDTAKKADRHQGGAVAERPTEFNHFINALHHSMLSEDAPFALYVRRQRRVVCGTDDSDDACRMIHLVSQSFAYPVIECISERYTAACVPVFSGVFIADYNAMLKFFSAACDLMHFHEVVQFRCSKRLIEFQLRWKTQACYALRERDLRIKMKKAVADAVTFDEQFMFQQQVFWMKQSVELVRQVVSLFSPSTFVNREMLNALRYVTELVTGYIERARTIMDFKELHVTPPPTRSNIPHNNTPHTVHNTGAHNTGAHNTGAHNTGAQKDNESLWRADILTLPHIGYVIADLLGLLNLFDTDSTKPPSVLLKPLQMHIDALLPSECRASVDGCTDNYRTAVVRIAQQQVADVRRAADHVFRQCAYKLSTFKTELEAFLLAAVCRSALPQLAGLQSVPPLFRMTNKPLPTEPSPYINATLVPLEDFYKASAPVVSPYVLDEWMTSIVDEVSAALGGEAEVLLSAVQVQGESLKRLQKQAQTLITALPPVTDVDKIHLQIRIDVTTFVESCLKRFRLTSTGRSRLLAVQKAIHILTAEAAGKVSV